MVLDLLPMPYGPALVKRTRAILSVSQGIFAQFLGVSVNTVQAWERGINVPKDVACRFMDEIRHNPDYSAQAPGGFDCPEDRVPGANLDRPFSFAL